MTVDSPATKKSEKFRGQELVARVKELIHQGNVRRIRVKNDEGHTVMEIPVTAGVVFGGAAISTSRVPGFSTITRFAASRSYAAPASESVNPSAAAVSWTVGAVPLAINSRRM